MVEISNDTSAYLLRQIYERTKIQNKELFDYENIAEFFGDINESSILQVSTDVESKLLLALENRKITKRIFAIFIEGLQNIFKHGLSDERGKHLGACLLTKTKTNYQIHFFNVSPIGEIKSMAEYLDYLNALNLDETKKFYLERLENGKLSERGGASLGYIIMKLKSGNNINYKFEMANHQHSCYHIEIILEIPIAK